jgi:DNA ligase (NAD+)
VSANTEQLSEVHEIGPAIAESVHNFFSSPSGKKSVADLREAGIDPQMEIVKSESIASLPLAGKTIPHAHPPRGNRRISTGGHGVPLTY